MDFEKKKKWSLKWGLMMLLSTLVIVPSKAQFKVVGYIWSRSDMVKDIKKVDLEKITHLNIAFINPDTSGNFKAVPGLDSVIEIAHRKNVKVLMSCGGGSRQSYYAELLTRKHRKTLVKNFIAVLDKYDLDGIDVDLEGEDIDGNYEGFVADLRKPLTKRNKLLTSALAWWTRDRISDRALAQFDFINIMAYDKTGPWKPDLGGQHAPYSYAEEHLNYWQKERGLKKEAMNIGLPFYGYGFGELPVKDRSFRQISWTDVVKKYPERMNFDEIILPDNGGTIYYNGRQTIVDKTQLASKSAGGVMIWQLLYDTQDEHSLLSLVDNTHKNLENKP
ncbi:glycosyl hydrolase family 18 protein [Pedobacter sp.]|uniref:glycosyl hydrolase family 18 protein n=1 Tax=Pedobacter sp. TaxID=1411316 RepID=UPI003BAD5B1A